MRIFSGIQPTGAIHIGNYLGAIKQWKELQSKDCLFCIVDLHALTVPYDTKELKKRINENVIVLLSSGISPKNIFVQSHVKEHSELNWLLSTVTPLGDLQRMTQFKEKSKKHSKNINAGLLNYPVLMAADILLYQTDIVPVGIDQQQHVEITREIARRFNNRFGKTFKEPKTQLPKTGAKIMSLTEPNKKMSKSDSPESYISLFDKPEIIKKKISSAQTDSGKEIKYSKDKPGISNLLTIYSLFSNKDIKQIEKKFQNKGYKEFKESLAELLIDKLEPFRKNKNQNIDKIIKQGAKKAEKLAQQTMKLVRKNMGL